MKKLPSFFCFLLLSLLCPVFSIAQNNEIPNGGFENWPDDFTPAGYGSFQAPQAQYAALRTVFKSTDARSGKFSVRLRNASIKEAIAQMNINTQGVNFPDQIIPSGVWSCEGNCKVPPKDNPGRSRFPVTKRYKTICGYYKGKLAGGDKILVSVVMFKEKNVIGGSDAGTIQHAFITQGSDKWKRFEIPVTYFGSAESVIPDAAALQISIVGKNYPQNAFAGGTGLFVTIGTEVLIDDVSFCVGKADVLVFTPKVLNEVSTPSEQDTASVANEQNTSNGTNVQIPENQHLNPGVQTFVNFDNDDNDAFYDYNPDDGAGAGKDIEISGGDDELIKIILRIPVLTITEAKNANRKVLANLQVEKGAENIRVWETDTKKTRIPIPKLWDTDTAFTQQVGEFAIKEIWIEGIKPHSVQQGTVLKFTHSEDRDFKDEFAITVIGIEKIEWIGKENSRNDQNQLDEDPNYRNPTDITTRPPLPEECGGNPGAKSLKPVGLRVFPDRRMKNGVLDQQPRNKVDVRVVLSVKPVVPVKIYFKSFDVDDPSASGTDISPGPDDVNNESWVDKERNVSDNRGFVGDSEKGRAGKLEGENDDGILEILFDDKEKKFLFEVTMQPGDNFRIVGSCDQDFLKQLRNDDEALNKGFGEDEKNENKQRIVNKPVLQAAPERVKEAEIIEPEKYASKTLTVWRFFHAEVDYMEEIGEDEIVCLITDASYSMLTGKTTIYLRENLKQSLTAITNISDKPGNNGLKDCFKKGTIIIDGVPYVVENNTAETSGSDYITITGSVPGLLTNKSCTLRTDDRKLGFIRGSELKDIFENRKPVEEGNNYCFIANRYEYAYVVPDFKTLNSAAANPRKKIPFKRNLKNYDSNDDILLEDYLFFDNRDKEADETFWTIYILISFLGATHEDGDPDSEDALSGIADKRNIGIHVFLQGITERTAGIYYSETPRGLGELDCIAHEIGHLFGVGGHEDKGLMGGPPDSRWFKNRTLGRIRSAKHP